MIQKGFNPDTNTQQYVELLFNYRFPAFKIRDIIPFSFVIGSGAELPDSIQNVSGVFYFGDIFQAGNCNLILPQGAVTCYLPSLRCIFNAVDSSTDYLIFIGWQITCDGGIAASATLPELTKITEYVYWVNLGYNLDGVQRASFAAISSNSSNNYTVFDGLNQNAFNSGDQWVIHGPGNWLQMDAQPSSRVDINTSADRFPFNFRYGIYGILAARSCKVTITVCKLSDNSVVNAYAEQTMSPNQFFSVARPTAYATYTKVFFKELTSLFGYASCPFPIIDSTT